MIAILSPAKTLDFAKPLPELVPTRARFAEDAHLLAGAAAKLGAKKLELLMNISESLATLNAERFSNFDNLPERPALFAFAGDVYTGFEARSLDEAAIDFAQDHVRMLSGLYGLLRPLDQIRPYRLEMGTKWAPAKGDLYGYWGDRVALALAQDAAADGSNTIINLASREYWSVVEGQLPPETRVITLDFRELGPNGLRFNSFAAKRARGMAARYIAEHRLTDVDALKGFDSDGYAYDADASDEATWRFVRQ